MAWKGLLPATLEQAGISLLNGEMRIPYRRGDGSTFRTRYKSEEGVWWGNGVGQLPFGLEVLPDAKTANESLLCICEGETDTLALRELRDNLPHVYAIGCPGATAWQKEWQRFVEDFQYVVILGDGDDAGHDFVNRTRGIIPQSIGAVLPDDEDVRSIIQGQSADILLEIIEEIVELEALIRKHFPWDGSLSFSEQVEQGEVMAPPLEQAQSVIDGLTAPVTPIRRDCL